MSDTDRIGFRDLRKVLGEKIDEAHFTKRTMIITKNGKDWAILGPAPAGPQESPEVR